MHLFIDTSGGISKRYSHTYPSPGSIVPSASPRPSGGVIDLTEGVHFPPSLRHSSLLVKDSIEHIPVSGTSKQRYTNQPAPDSVAL
ncbi:hypothetical protein vBEcoMWL3_gp144c [Escherichia phage vB_EcoM_WL-3]|nr:hypothetical protein vBEcoMWL3_gp144c [Escherichia phage vB_EcoM_WL-3]